MKNKNRPFFYEKKNNTFRNVLLTFFVFIVFGLFLGMQIPRSRQILAEPLFAAGSFAVNTAKDLFDATRRYREPDRKPQTYDPLDLPEKQVLFAESLESLSEKTQADPLADLRQTPTVSEYGKVAEWEYLDPNLNYAVRSGNSILPENTQIRLAPPVFEHADLNNDGAAILSALLRFWGEVENQYRIAGVIHPNSFDPVISFTDIGSFIEENYPDYSALVRINGDKDILTALLQKGIPVLLRIRCRSPYSFWLHDDRISGQYIIIYGYDGKTDTFSYQDTFKSNTLEISSETLMAEWYPYQRKYMVLYPADRDDAVREALSENYFEELNDQKAEVKFRTDSEMLPQNPFAQFNYALVLKRIGDEKGAWDFFRKALELSLPQRFIGEHPEMLDTARNLGYADEMDEMIDPLLRRDPYDEELLVYRGWAAILRGDIKKGRECFGSAERINPNNETVRYAVKYLETML